jgi:hypothetical protein
MVAGSAVVLGMAVWAAVLGEGPLAYMGGAAAVRARIYTHPSS